MTLIFEMNSNTRKWRSLTMPRVERFFTFFYNSDLVIEVGFGKEKTTQVEAIMKNRHRVKYRLVIGSQNIRLMDDMIVKIPLNYFLSM